MATSGSTDFAITRDDIIQKVLEALKVIPIGGIPSSTHSNAISTILNLFIKIVPGVKVWKTEWTQKTFSASSTVTGDDDIVYTCILGHTSSASDEPISGANYTSKWAQFGSSGSGDDWVTSTAYTSTGDFTDSSNFFGISEAFIRKNEVDTQLKVITRSEYMSISDKMAFGTPSKIWYDKQSGTIHLAPIPDDTDSVLHYTRRLRVEDLDEKNDNPDFPIEWGNAIIWGVAKDALAIYTVDDARARAIKDNAKTYINIALGSDTEEFSDMQFIVGG
jgi:hypothetical protein